ncbi:MAG TPA: ABC transporter substrate-binding protein [Nitrospirota bacterium]|nr:ABC transporter substrate-binding protein [Nitrospirota bacterium]
MKIRIGHLSTFYHTAILLMANSDTDSRVGAEIEWKLMGTGPAIMKAFGRGELDMAYIGLPPAIIGIDQGIKVTCVAGGHVEGTVMAGKAQWTGFPETKDLGMILRQFRGHRIGVPGKGSIHDVILFDCIERFGLEREIEIINYPWADLVTEAVVKDEVSAALGTPALAVAIKRFAGGRLLYPPSRLWPDNPSYGIIVDTGYLERETATVEKFLGLHEEATEFIRRRPADAARLIADYVGIVDEHFVLDTLMLSPKYCAQLTEGYLKSTMKFVTVLKKLGYIGSEITQEKIFSPYLIARIHPERDHYNDGIDAIRATP